MNDKSDLKKYIRKEAYIAAVTADNRCYIHRKGYFEKQNKKR